MGRRFPEFCILQATCRVNGKASSSATGDARVASYQAAINSVAARYYADRPFMVEVLNKWLETNQDFIRNPVGYAASNSLSTPPSAVREVEVRERIADASPVLSPSGSEPSPSPPQSDGCDVRDPIRKFLPLTWTSPFHFLPPLWNLVIRTLYSVIPSSFSRSKWN